MPTNYNGYTVPEPTDIADAPAAFEQFSDSIPFSEYVAVESLSADTTVDDSYNGKMIFATADITLTFGTLTDGFSVAVTADTGVTVDYLGVDKASQQTTAYQVATVVAVNETNIISIAGASAPCPPCPPAGTPEAKITAITGSGITHTYGSYIAYEFLTSGTITCTEGTVPEALIVGGGGGGSSGGGGGGGAGGYLYATGVYLPAASHSVIVGAGGANSIDTDVEHGQNGTSSQIADIYVSVGGGGGGNGANPSISRYSQVGATGGSGGGGGGHTGIVTRSGGSGITNQGSAGGVSSLSADAYGGGGGGGSSAAAGDGTGSAGGAGGAGTPNSITGSSVTYSGGGGGGTASGSGGAGGTGGGGAGGASAVAGSAGTATLGGGGGGGGVTANGGAGGSGVVIVKVLATNASSVDKSGWTEVTAAMLAAAEKKRKAELAAAEKKRTAERKKLEKKLALEKKNEELSGQTNKTDIKENK